MTYKGPTPWSVPRLRPERCQRRFHRADAEPNTVLAHQGGTTSLRGITADRRVQIEPWTSVAPATSPRQASRCPRRRTLGVVLAQPLLERPGRHRAGDGATTHALP